MNIQKLKNHLRLTYLISSERRLYFLTAVLLLLVLGVGAFLIYYEWKAAVQSYHNALMVSAQKLSRSLNVERLKALKGDSSDVSHPIFNRTKSHLHAHQRANPSIRSIQLIGRKIDGTLFYYLDSQALNSPQSLGLGQRYATHSAEVQEVFERDRPFVSPMRKHRLGNQKTVYVPIASSYEGGQAQAQQDEARAMVHAAVSYYYEQGRERFLDEINDPHGRFRRGELYAFAYDTQMTIVGHPVKPGLIGVNLLDKKDWYGGKYFRREIRDLARDEGTGWVNYEYENPTNGVREPKVTFVEAVDDLIVCAGAYRGSHSVFAVLAVEVDARVQDEAIWNAILPSIVLTLALVLILISGCRHFLLRSRMTVIPLSMRRLEASLIVATGLLITTYAAWKVHLYEVKEQRAKFTENAYEKFNAITHVLKNIRDFSDGLVNSSANAESLTQEKFAAYAEYLTKMRAVQSWAWVSIVPASERNSFVEREQQFHAEFEIFDRYPQKERVLAEGRTVYYPLTYISPMSGNEGNLGCDLGSELKRSAIVEECIRTGYPTASEPLTLLKDEGTDTAGILVLRPVYTRGHEVNSRQLKGFVLCAMRFRDLIAAGKPDNRIQLAISQIGASGKDSGLANSWDRGSVVNASIQAQETLLIFGKSFQLTAYAGSGFSTHTIFGGGLLTAIMGTLVTALVATLLTGVLRRREQLEALVQERTHRLYESEHRFSSLLNSMSEMVFLKDAQLNYIFANAPLLRYLGKESHEVIGQSDATLLPPDAVENCRESDQRVLESGVAVVAQEMIEGRVYETHKFPVAIAKNNIGVGGYIADVTERERQTEAVREAMLKAEEANRAKSAFLATMSHEIRTPLNAVIGMSSLLLNTHLDNEQTDYAKTIISSGDALLTLINDILDYSKIEAGKLELECASFDLSDAVTTPLEIIASKANEKGVLLSYNIAANAPSTLVGDSARIRQVLLNFLSNAVKFTDVGEVSVEVSAQAQSTPHQWLMEFAVKDSGIGMDAVTLEKLFRPFVQADSSVTRKFGGTGLGLAICKRIVEQMGGKIFVHSEVGKGSVFGFSLAMSTGVNTGKVTPAPALAQSAKPNEFGRTKGELAQNSLTILVADDNTVNLKVMRALISQLGHRIETAENGKVALEKLLETHYDVVLMDVQMPEMDGLTATQAYCEKVPNREDRPLIVALTAGAMQGDREACLAAGMDDYLSKPIRPEHLIECLERHAVQPRQTVENSPRSEVLENSEKSVITEVDAERGVDDLPLFDPENMELLVDPDNKVGTLQILHELFDDYLLSFKQNIQIIEEALKSDNRSQLLHGVHKLVGGAGAVGMMGVSRYCNEIQEQLKSNPEYKAPDNLVHTLNRLNEINIQARSEWIKRITQS